MKGKMHMYYDEDGDYLEIFIGESRPNYGEEISRDVTIFRDKKTNEVIGVGILHFRKRAQNLSDIAVHLPFEINFLTSKA